MVTDQSAHKIGSNGTGTAASAPPPVRTVRKRKRIPKWATWVAIAIVAGAGWLIWSRTQANKNNATNMITATVTRGDLVETVTATGSVTAQTGAEVKIGSQITGVIKHLYADVGSKVKAGELIAQLDLPDLQAQVATAKAALAAAQTKLAQQQAGVAMTDTQVRQAVTQAEEGVGSAQAKLRAAQANANQTAAQTPTDIRKAETALASARAALSTANSNLKQTQAGAALQIATARDQLTQAQATAANSALNLTRQQSLATKGYVAQNVADQAKATAAVNDAAVSTAQQNIQLVQQKVTADQQAARDAVTLARQNIAAAQAVLTASKAETYTVEARRADVNDSASAARQAAASRQIAIGNLPLITQKQQDVQAARDAVQQAASQLAFYQANLNKSYIRSPISGTVLQLAAQQGETLAAGLSAPTLIIVADLSRLQIDSFIDETQVGSVKPGQPVQIVLDAFPKHTFKGTVSKVASGSTIQNGVVTYDVTIAIQVPPKYQIKPDMTAAVTIETGQRSNVVLVPSVAVQVGVRGSTVNVVTQKDGHQTVTAVRVKTGGSDGINTEITDGLTEGQIIAVAGAPRGGGGDGGAPKSSSPFSSPGRGGGGGGGGRGGGGRGG